MTTNKKIQPEDLIHRENNELNLIDLFIILARRKRIIIFSMFFLLLVAIGYLWFTKPLPAYEGTAIVQLDTEFNAGGLTMLMRELKIKYPHVNVIKKSAVNLITIKIQSYAKAKIKSQLNKVVDQLLQKYNIMYNTVLLSKDAEQQKKQDVLNKKIKLINSQIAELDHIINAVKIAEAGQASILVLEKIKLMGNSQEIKEKIYTLNDVSETKSIPTKLIHGITIKTVPVKSKVVRVIFLSIVIGLMLGIIGAFLAELIANIRRQMVVIENKT